MENVHTLLNDCCKFIESRIDEVLAELHDNTSDENQIDLTQIQHLMYLITRVMTISTDFNSNIDKDSILMRIVKYLDNASNINNIEMVLNEMQWIGKYHSNMHEVGSKFELTNTICYT